MIPQAVRRNSHSIIGAVSGAIVGISAFLMAAFRLEGTGFPLDDAWIHQVYARNLVRSGSWAFQPGEVSAGSTSPLWSILQTPAHVMRIPPFWWVAFLGFLTLIAMALIASNWLQEGRSWGGWKSVTLGALVAMEWHLVWAALSGMETLAAGLLALAVNLQLQRDDPSAARVGVFTGLGVWLRPDLMSLALPAVLVWLFRLRKRSGAWTWVGRWIAGASLTMLPYLGFQLLVGGRPWPTTFYAKQAEYAVLQDLPLMTRYLDQLRAPAAGMLTVLAPGLFIWIVATLKRRDWDRMAPVIWAASYVALFAWRLPVTYQHGRYIMPVIPVVLVLGLQGLLEFLDGPGKKRPKWVLRRAWVAALAIVVLTFLGMGARAYALDVAIIRTEMVRTSKWVAENTEEGALIAAHDIGALGYLGNRPILDLAGLVSPEVIPILRDEMALAEFMDRNGADYLMTFPDWYPTLSGGSTLIYSSGGSYSPAAGGSNMGVYRP
jgi:hypothetical protein